MCESVFVFQYTEDDLGNTWLCVYVCRKLDYDYLPDHKYEFLVMAIDGGSPPLSGSATVQVSNGF